MEVVRRIIIDNENGTQTAMPTIVTTHHFQMKQTFDKLQNSLFNQYTVSVNLKSSEINVLCNVTRCLKLQIQTLGVSTLIRLAEKKSMSFFTGSIIHI
jgi:hypothetical protein